MGILAALDLHPYTLVVSSFTVLLIQQLVGFIGKSTIQEFAWLFYLRVGGKLGLSNSFVAHTKKQEELHKLNREKRSISAQDEYAKWTKLNRQAEKLTAEVKSLSDDIAKDKSKINSLVGVVLLFLTTLPLWVFRLWFRKSVLFYLPTGVFPYYVERVLAIPFFASGSVGLTVWMFAVNNVISSVLFLLTFPFKPSVPIPIRQTKVEEVVPESAESKESSPEVIDIADAN
ncbi:coiled-coil membrane protein [Scheffersomyces stipitis CBS 6054]|uniref:Golgi to ER traffic protein 1 n=1 Tax=Scheffersomyces stipitis (strain ATCC 58785 / CBS 6054 / NBRC 10063 / NRRL Y-11545) TaxID=322104 RepID=GET1_PICST|nr:coiled-coil membrane protein [Scheffersomyces stipitis CBS 6054]A3LMX9.2 RecName: Full=Golgi to ER traffic protein 1; AltName: Full=Guided entry of tail-anchored proteins 1 [Scheffersomyces stipitis CBS 6054]ABN64763.2 coiled-coil membrane protein [Scheffersomyces stipitis CBS 6054]KAG2736402.1 hypothetical protein G9P44_000492 [Scheffersomyces stipitis]